MARNLSLGRYKTWFIGTNWLAILLSASLLLIMVNYLNSRHYLRMDVTTTKIYTLSEKTLSILKGIEKKIEVYVFIQPTSPLYSPVRELLKEYLRNCRYIDVHYLDPDRDIARARQLVEQFKIDDLDVVVFSQGDRSKYVSRNDLAEFIGGNFLLGQPARIKEFKGESAFTSVILNITSQRQAKVYFVSGHKEKDIDDPTQRGISIAKEKLIQDNLRVEKLELLSRESIPEDADLLVIAGPQKRYTDTEIKIIDNYLKKDGRAFFMLDPLFTTGLEDYLKQWGIVVGNDIVVDPARKLPFVSPANLFVVDYAPHKIVQSLKDVATLFPLTRSVDVDRGNFPEGYTVMSLAHTSDKGWAEVDFKNPQFRFDKDKDKKGPISIGVSVYKKAEAANLAGERLPKGTRIVAMGDSDFILNTQINNLANLDLFLNIANWLIEEEELISISAKPMEKNRLNLSQSQMNAIFWQTVVGLPLIAICLGIGMWWRRKR